VSRYTSYEKVRTFRRLTVVGEFVHGIKGADGEELQRQLSEEVRKGLSEKADKGTGRLLLPVDTRTIALVRGLRWIRPRPISWRAFRVVPALAIFMKALTARAFALGLTHPGPARMSKSEIHRILHNHLLRRVRVKGRRYVGSMSRWSPRSCCRVQDVFMRANRPTTPSTGHEFCWPTVVCSLWVRADARQRRDATVITGAQLPWTCGNTYIREEVLSKLFADVVQRVSSARVGVDRRAAAKSQADKVEGPPCLRATLQQRHGGPSQTRPGV